MALSSGAKFRCYPTEEQKRILSQWMGCQRVIYNAKVEEQRYFQALSRKSLSLTGIKPPVDQKYSQFKDRELSPYLFDVPPQLLRNGATRFMGAISRYRNGLAKQPAHKKKYGNDRVWITSELFRFVPTGSGKKKGSKTIYEHRLLLGNGKYPVGELKFNAHTEYERPATITVSKNAGKWYVSFSYESEGTEIPRKELIERYGSLDKRELDLVTVGIDRNASESIIATTAGNFDYSDIQKLRMGKKEIRRKRYQRLMARRKKGSNRRKRAAFAAARCQSYATNVRQDFAHQKSREMVNSAADVFVFEDLKIRNMTKRPARKVSKGGTFLPNGARAKSGLNRVILASAWGTVKKYTEYKASRAGKLVIAVPPHRTSQECSKCSHTHPDNRATTRLFVCGNCGYTADAHENAAMVIKNRGISMLMDGTIAVRESKRTMRLRKKQQLGTERAEGTRGEKTVRRIAEHRETLVSENRETPTTTELVSV